MPWDLAVPSRGVGGRKGMPAGPCQGVQSGGRRRRRGGSEARERRRRRSGAQWLWVVSKSGGAGR
eukprot:4651609-Prymnesium_polylepis.1